MMVPKSIVLLIPPIILDEFNGLMLDLLPDDIISLDPFLWRPELLVAAYRLEEIILLFVKC
jgi:hypothetical protein